MLNIDEEIFNKIVHEFPKIIKELRDADKKVIKKLESIREKLLESINEEN